MTPPSPTSSALTGLPLQKNQNTVNFVGNTGSEVYNSVVVRGNFVVAGGQNNWPTTMYNQQAAGSLISGAAAPVFNNSGWGGGKSPAAPALLGQRARHINTPVWLLHMLSLHRDHLPGYRPRAVHHRDSVCSPANTDHNRRGQLLLQS